MNAIQCVQKYRNHHMACQTYGRVLLIICVTLSITICGVALAEEELDSGPLRIDSETEAYSAKIYIQEEEQGSVPEKAKEKDKTRKQIGMGESVTLTLNGKAFLIGDVSKISWTIQEGAHLGAFKDEPTGQRSVMVKMYDNLTKDGKMKVEATTELGEKVAVELSVIVPVGISAKHRRKSYDRNSPDFKIRGMPSITKDGETVNAGVSAILELTVLPVEVNFQKITVIERDQGCIPPPQAGSLATAHHPKSNRILVSEHNRLFDNIASMRPITLLQNYVLPENWTWKCDWNSYSKDKDVSLIESTEQTFYYNWVNQENNIATTTVSKFNCSTTRTTEANNKHAFH